MTERTGRDEWAQRFEQQSQSCWTLGSPLYGRLLGLLAADLARAGVTWGVLEPHSDLRFGQAGPLRLLGAAHRLALGGEDPEWASILPSCGGAPPSSDDDLFAAWSALVDRHGEELSAGLTREVQTNEVARSAGLGLALALTRFGSVHLVELGCSGGLNLRLDRFNIRLGSVGLGPQDSTVRVAPEVRADVLDGAAPGLRLPEVVSRVGLDPHPVDAASAEGALTLLSFLWPDQTERIERARAAIGIAGHVPAELRRTQDTAAALEEVLGRSVRDADAPAPVGTVIQHSIVWQYIPTEVRWRITAAIEAAGEHASENRPLAWVRYEPDEWDRLRAAVWLRSWPGGSDRLVAQVDYHGRWIRPVPEAVSTRPI